MLNYLKNLANEIVTKPEKTSRAVVASILIVGICALTLDLGPRIMPEYFSSSIRAIDPLTSEELAGGEEKTSEELSVDVQTCFANRKSDKAKSFLGSFEKSFNGILPGSGNLLREHAGMVASRRDALVLEVMKRYANLKFCLDGDSYKTIHLEGYSSIVNDLDAYIQVRGWEKSGDQNNQGLYMTAFTKEYDLAEKNLTETRSYVENTIDSAIEAAKAADQQTSNTISNLTTETSNKLSDRANSTARTTNDIGNSQTQVLGRQSEQLDKIIQLLAYQNAGPIPATKKAFFEGTGVSPSILKWRDAPADVEDKYFEAPLDVTPETGETVELTLPEANGLKDVYDQATNEITNSANGNLYAYGILNLVDDFTRADFLALGFKKAILLYTAAQNNFDPYAPRAGFLSGAQDLPYPPAVTVESQLCKSIDTPDAACFGVSI